MINFIFSSGFAAILLLSGMSTFPSVANAHGISNGGKCYNGWHLKDGKCHKPHKEDKKRFIKNGGKCYNDWYLDTKTGKCVESRGLWGWLTD